MTDRRATRYTARSLGYDPSSAPRHPSDLREAFVDALGDWLNDEIPSEPDVLYPTSRELYKDAIAQLAETLTDLVGDWQQGLL